MSTSSKLIERVENAVYHEPYMIPILFKDRKVKAGFLHSRLRRYVPHRIGIEFECFGDFANQFCAHNKLTWSEWEDFERYFGLCDFSQDTSLRRLGKGYVPYPYVPLTDNHEEIRVSIRDYRQLHGLYKILTEMAKYCTISSDCGIHIHVDLTKYGTSSQKDKAVKWFNSHLSNVESIFPKYTGTYNKRVAQKGKGSWVNLSSKDTVEFRIAPLTFDYEVLIHWIVKCSKLVSQMITECYLKPDKLNRKAVEKDDFFTIELPDLAELEACDAVISSIRQDQGVWNSHPELESMLARYGISSANRRMIIDGLLYSDLDRENIDYHIEGGILVMNYPDGECVTIALTDARQTYLERGIAGVIMHARVERSTTSIRDSGTTGEGYITIGSNSYSTSTTSWVSSNSVYWGV